MMRFLLYDVGQARQSSLQQLLPHYRRPRRRNELVIQQPHRRALNTTRSRTSSEQPAPSASSKAAPTTSQTFRVPQGQIKLDLTGNKIIGTAQSRGERPYQEDTFSIRSVLIPTLALKRNLVNSKDAVGWTPQAPEGYPGEDTDLRGGNKRQVTVVGVYDGHGGAFTSQYARDNLTSLLESADPAAIPDMISAYRAQGGYLRRYRGGPLERFRESQPTEDHKSMSLSEMAVLAFLQADNEILAKPEDQVGNSGSVATVAMLYSLDLPHSLPFYSSDNLCLTIAHLGDTRAVLASRQNGRARTLTESHHPDSRTESKRLQQSGTGVITDSFGESRWGGILANTRGLGDRKFKSLGVFAEPDVQVHILDGSEWAFLALVSDGVTDSMTDQELVDVCRNAKTPAQAAKAIVSFAEEAGAEDNITAVVVPLLGFGKMGGTDTSAARREYRLKQVATRSSRQNRM